MTNVTHRKPRLNIDVHTYIGEYHIIITITNALQISYVDFHGKFNERKYEHIGVLRKKTLNVTLVCM